MDATINISKKFTINTGNYSSVQPSISLTINNVPVEKIQQVHKTIEIIADGLLHEQIESDILTMADMKKYGLGEYFSSIDKEKMREAIQLSINSIVNIKGEDNE